MKFDKAEMKRVISNDVNYRLIERMKNYDIIDRFVITEAANSDSFELIANISSNGRRYNASLVYDFAGEVFQYACECSYCTQSSACAHIGVLMEAVNELEPTYYPFYFESERHTNYEEYLKRARIKQSLQSTQSYLENQRTHALERTVDLGEQVEVIPFLKADEDYYNGQWFCIGFKIGVKRKYVIKNLKSLLKDIASGAYHWYGKDLSFQHSWKKFTSLSLEVLRFIQDEIVLQDENYGFNNKDIRLDERSIDLFFEAFASKGQLSNMIFKTIDLSQARIKLNVESVDNYLEVSLAEHVNYLKGIHGLYQIHAHAYSDLFTCTQYTFNGNRAVLDLLDQLNQRPLILDESHYQDFNRYVLNSIADYIELGGVEFPTLMLDNRIELYGDINAKEEVVFSIKALRDDHVLNQQFTGTQTSSVNFMRVLDIFTAFSAFYSDESSLALFDLHQDTTLAFLKDGLKELQTISIVFVSESLKRLSLNLRPVIRVGLSFANDLLQVDVESDDIPRDEMQDVLSAYKRKRKFYRLKNGEMVLLEERGLDEVTRLLEQVGAKSSDLDQGELHVNPYRIFTIESLADNYGLLAIEKADSFKSHLDKFQTVETTEFPVPAGMNAALRQYQIQGYQWLRTLNQYGFSGILADDMGLGKTLQMITYLTSMPRHSLNLVVCPSSVLLNWEQEIRRFSPSLNVVTLTGSKSWRMRLLEDIEGVDILVTSYDYLRRDLSALEELSFETVVLDEAQYIKNHNTQNSKSVKRLKSRQRFALTGTPIENSLAELWSIFDFLMPGYLYSYSYFREYFEGPIIKEDDNAVSLQLKRLVQPFILRRLKRDVLQDLPEKTEMNMLIDFSDEERRLYYANLAQVNLELQDVLQADQGNDVQILAMLTRLRRLCCEPRTIYENIKHPSSKMEAVIGFISSLKEDGKKVLLFSSFTSVLDLIAEELIQQGISYRMIDGRVDKQKRQERIQEFQEGDVDVFLISLRAGGTGINLTAAEVVIHFDPWWNISAQNQATDRAYRIGQQNNVLVYRFIMKGSIEEKIQRLQEKKKVLTDTFVEGSEGSIITMSKADILSLFSMENPAD